VTSLKGVRLGITLCEDAWNVPGFRDQDIYTTDPMAALQEQGAELIVNLSASPFRIGRGPARLALGRAHIAQTGLPFVMVNQVGGNDDLLFDGHSFALDAAGRVAARASGFTPDLVFWNAPAGGGGLHDWVDGEAEEVFRALVMGIRDYLDKCGFRRAVVGLSGGIDSSVVAVLAAAALGPENVTGLSMPSPYTAAASVEDARTLTANLGVRLEEIAIQNLFADYKASLRPLFKDLPEDVTEENLQARIRGNLLMAVSNKTGGLLLSTGNKSELSVGYCTLYGDMAGGLSVLSDVLKTRVYALARWINRETEIIPRRVLERPPTAELRPNQTDQDSLPPYPVLDAILEAYVERRLEVREIVSQGFDPGLVREVVAKVDANEYKRQQAAPGLKITGKAFGSGRRIPIAQRFHLSMQDRQP
ncbi:MAG: NAD+ synthase, partial [Nitrospinaceae bacterium]